MNSEYIMWEAPCDKCGTPIYTDEYLGSPYFGSGCECGGRANEDRVSVSDEPHPALWG